ncbi:hypothetical protein DH2020_013352 [Rehmannia glutinosa]|uniref:Auxin-responsive protein n=1 Tax=Rehmannia glutinosa TaxID=99300 RepID=A0ABR0X205_REHGL
MEKNGVGLETELRLGLPGGDVEKNEKKRVFLDFCGGEDKTAAAAESKNQVVGWPPVAAFRRRNSFNGGGAKMYVKVSMDGAPFLRKVDLSMHKGYSQLVKALEELFGCFGIVRDTNPQAPTTKTGPTPWEALKDEEENCEYVPIYEDKDGDWMLLGDVPWEARFGKCLIGQFQVKPDIIIYDPKMFTESCKRLRIMKRADTNGVGLRAKDLLKGLSKEE